MTYGYIDRLVWKLRLSLKILYPSFGLQGVFEKHTFLHRSCSYIKEGGFGPVNINKMSGIFFLTLQIQIRRYRLFRCAIVLLSTIIILGCAHPKPTLVAEPVLEPTPNNEHETFELREKIKRLQELITEKDTVIQKQREYQRKQAREQQETSEEVVRVQKRLRRLATKPSTASAIAEVEVAMENLKQDKSLNSDLALQQQAQSLLDTALTFYKQEKYAAAMNYASQAHEFISMVTDQKRKAPYSNRKIVSIHVPIILRTITNVNLRQDPHSNAKILNILEKDSILITNAYRGNWLRVQTEDGRQGWVSHTLVETATVNRREFGQE